MVDNDDYPQQSGGSVEPRSRDGQHQLYILKRVAPFRKRTHCFVLQTMRFKGLS